MLKDDEILLVDKPAGMSSFGVVARVRRKLTEEARARVAEIGVVGPKRVKVGHTGTLDPFATGLLILLIGNETKRAGEFLKLDKEYVATMKLGATSTTGDPEGEISEGKSEPVSLAEVEAILGEFVGKIKQRPPVFSAIKINGERAYKLARKGMEVEMPEREVEIYEIEVLGYEWPELKMRVKVSSGTYIRSLAEDIGKRLGCGAYLTALRRTQVGKYRVEDAVGVDEFCGVK